MLDRLDVRFFGGYCWYAYPLAKGDDAFMALLEGLEVPEGAQKLPLCHLGDEVKAMSKYHADGVLIITQTPQKPSVGAGWAVEEFTVPEGLTYEDGVNKIRHVHNVWGDYSIFVGLKLPLRYSDTDK